jgi:FkbM family methyltransferase
MIIDIPDVSIPDKERSLCQELLSGSARSVYLLGRNKYAESAARLFKVDGFIDDGAIGSSFLDRPVLGLSQVPADSNIVSCVVDGRPVTAMARLHKLGLDQAVDYFTLLKFAGERLAPVDFCENNEADVKSNPLKYDWLYSILSDERSRSTLKDLLRFRVTGDLRHMQPFSFDLSAQYFEDFVAPAPPFVFVDGGGFNGETTLRFVAKFPQYQRIHYFEPSPQMLDESKRALQNKKNIVFHASGLAEAASVVKFDISRGPASRVSDDGSLEICLVALDDVVKEPVSYIKLDVEGLEVRALAGAALSIEQHHPLLAICVYHDQSHFWQVPEKVLATNPRYKVFLRHYTEGVFETVMYFVPRS